MSSAVTLVAAATLRFLHLGDSYTIGEAVPTPDTWPALVAAALQKEGHTVESVVVAKTGWTTDELAAGIEAAAPKGHFDFVTLLIGVNNQYRGRSLEEYRTQFRSLLAQALGFAGGRKERTLVISIPDWGVTPFAKDRDRAQIAHQIDAFNAVAFDEAKKLGVKTFSVTELSREATKDPALTAADGLHPSGPMYKKWAAAMLPAVFQPLFRKGSQK